MQLDVAELRDFYVTPLGRIVRNIVSTEVRTMWPSITGDQVVGLGHTTPFLRSFIKEAGRVVAMMPAAEGVLHWPRDGLNLTALTYEDCLPLADNSVDKILAIHLVEVTRDPLTLLRECWRVLVPTGRILVVAPYRTGSWARAESTPFGLGRPYSRAQLSKLMETAFLEPQAVSRFLFVPPIDRRYFLRSTRGFERLGRQLWPRFAGLVAVEAQKNVVRGLPAGQPANRLRLAVPGLAPVPKPAACTAVSASAKTRPVRQEGSKTTTAR
ncbi:MAG: methyltransferase domain-containing protein [Pseudomonadota bacterium]